MTCLQKPFHRGSLLDALNSPASAPGLGSTTSARSSAFGQPEVQTVGGLQLVASCNLDLFGRIASSDAAAKAVLLATTYGRDVVRLAVASSVVSGYITLQRGLLTADLGVVQSEADRLVALAQLYQAMGGGWSGYVGTPKPASRQP